MESKADCINKNKVSKLTLNPASPGSPITPADPGEPWQKRLNIQLDLKHGKNSFLYTYVISCVTSWAHFSWKTNVALKHKQQN